MRRALRSGSGPASTWACALAFALGCDAVDEDGEVAACEVVSSACTRGEGGFEVCCSSRGCSWVAWDGRSFTSARDAWTYCAPERERSSGATIPSDASDPNREGSIAPAGTGGVEPAPRDVSIDPSEDDGLEGDGRGPVEERGSSTPSRSEEDTENDGSDTSASSSSASSGACYGSPISCGARYTSSSCEQDYSGCFWQESYCGGAAYSCGYFSSASNCNAHGGCAWSYYYNDCRGGAWQCHNLYSRGACYDQLGCYWIEGGCFGSAGNCGSRASPSSCNGVAGCYWQ